MSPARRIVRTLVAATIALGAVAVAAPGAGTRLVFVGCPILRNTDLPCWLGESANELYYLGPQGDLTADFYPPQFRHKMLVEGVVSGDARICGGIVLKPVKVSVLPELDVTCNITLPASAFPDPPNHRGSGPSGVRGAQAPPPPARPIPTAFNPPFSARTFMAPFDADTERLWRQAQSAIEDAARFADAAKASRIEVTGYRAAIRLSNGKDYTEDSSLPKRRAEAVGQALRTWGLPPSTRMSVKWHEAALPYAGSTPDPTGRSVSIEVVP